MTTTVRLTKSSIPHSVLLNESDAKELFFALGKNQADLVDARFQAMHMEPYRCLTFPLLFGRVLVLQRMPHPLGLAWFNRSELDQAEHQAMLEAGHVHR
jgi:hypothetical protein